MRAPSTRSAVGIDVGGTKIAAGLVDAEGNRAPVGVLPTARGDGHVNSEAVRELVAIALASAGGPVAGIGLSVTTTVDERGRLRDASDWLGWAGHTGADIVGGEFGDMPVLCANDALCGAVAELDAQAAGTPARSGTFLYVTLGTGLAHTAVVDGQPLAGAHGGALFTAWTPAGFDLAGHPLPSWEELAAGPALAAAFDGGRDARPLVAAARAGDARALDVLRRGADAFGGYLATLVQTYDPHRLVIGGGLAHGVPEYVEAAVERLRALVRQEFFARVDVRPAALGAGSGWVGAGLLALDASSAAAR